MGSPDLDTVRRFNRAVTRRIGVLEESYLARGRPLGEARLLFEIGLSGGMAVQALRARLGLDSGYLSRLLRSLEGQGLVIVSRSGGDARARRADLTAAGREEFAAYDRLSDEVAASVLATLRPRERERLVAAMADVERLLRRGALVVEQERATSDDARFCLDSYVAELATRFDGGFDPASGNSLDPAEVTPPRGWFLIARLEAEPVGCGVLKRLDAATGEIKRVWTAPSARGLGVASRIMDRLEELAADAGFARVVLDTNRALTEARSMYALRGYREIAAYNANPYADHWFEKVLWRAQDGA